MRVPLLTSDQNFISIVDDFTDNDQLQARTALDSGHASPNSPTIIDTAFLPTFKMSFEPNSNADSSATIKITYEKPTHKAYRGIITFADTAGTGNNLAASDSIKITIFGQVVYDKSFTTAPTGVFSV